jgi:hypothetical protein
MLPKITKESLDSIITSLEDRFPDKLPHNHTTTEQMYMLIGQQQVIRHLREIMEVQHG